MAADYGAFVSEYYDSVPPVAARQDLEFYRRLAGETGGPILELGCGTGRILLAQAEAGHRVVGLDLSEAMLERARAKLARQPAEVRARVRLVQRDMTSFELGEKFRLVTIPFRPFQHLLEVSQQLACLAAAYRHLEPGGTLALDFFHTDPRRMLDPHRFALRGDLPDRAPGDDPGRRAEPESAPERYPHPEVELPGGRRVLLSERTTGFHRATQTNDVELIYTVTEPDGRQERFVFAFTVRYFFRYEVEHLLARAGFRLLATWGNFDRSPLSDDSPEMIFTAARPA
jgi:SAM-dependent methyltransferase